MKPSEWVISILDRYRLEKPDGRPLYRYRITDQEFRDLANLLTLSSHMGIEHVSKKLYLWDAAFVIYSAEWWRRHYAGEWGWEGVFRSVGLGFNDLANSRRNELIESGLRRWRREVRSHNGRRNFLGTVATEGGLPLHQLAGTGGWLENILKPVLRKHVSRDFEITALIDAYQDLIPKSFRTTEINQILGDIVQILAQLRKEHKLMEKESPLQWLDVNRPNWRDLFPLPIDDESGRSLLSDLIDTASKTIEVDSKRNPFEIERYLIRAETTLPGLVAHLEIPTFVSLDSIGYDIVNNRFPHVFEVEVFEPGGMSWAWCRGILTTYKEMQSLKLSGRALRIEGVNATKEFRLRIKDTGKSVYEFDVINGQPMDTGLPWMFKSYEDKWLLHGYASQSVKEEFAIVYMPNGSVYCSARENFHYIECGNIFGGKILKITGELFCQLGDEQYRLSAGREESIVQYDLTGKRFDNRSNPVEVFIGVPYIKEVNLITEVSSKVTDARLLAKPIGLELSWRPLSDMDTGCCEIRLRDVQDNILFRRRVGILDSEFSYVLIPDKKQVNIGIIELTNVGEYQINVCADNIKHRLEKVGSVTKIFLESEGMPPLSVDVSFLRKGHRQEILLTLPFPSKGALLFDPHDKQIPFSTLLHLNDLYGYRLKVFSDNHNNGKNVILLFSLHDPAVKHEVIKDIYMQRQIRLNKGITELSVYDWKKNIDDLMSVSVSLDALVKVSMVTQGQEDFQIKISRYKNQLQARWNDGVVGIESSELRAISNDELSKTQLSALYLNQPEQTDVILEPKMSQGIMTGEWMFYPEKRQLGPWLIYPSKESEIKLRTLLWNVGEHGDESIDDISEIDSLPKAVRIDNQDMREQAIRSVLRQMSENLDHKSWIYIDIIWEKTNHLPMVTFDMWKIAVSEYGFLASLLIKNHIEILNRLEQELPLIWELVRLSNWTKVLILYKQNLSSNLNDDELMRQLLLKKIESIETLKPSMQSIGMMLRKILLEEESRELKVFEHPDAIVWLKLALTTEYQDLLRRNDLTWPIHLKDYIFHKCQELPRDYVSLLHTHHGYQISVVFLPVLLAWRLVSDDEEEWLDNAAEIFKVKQIKEFDEQWFDISYRCLTSWLFQANKYGMRKNVSQ